LLLLDCGDFMKKTDYNDVKSDIPGLVINYNGEIITMNDGTHNKFFQSIIKDETDLLVEEDNLEVLMKTIMSEFNYITYIGCSSGDRVYSGGMFLINPFDKLTDKQLNTLINLYSNMSYDYKMDILLPGTNDDYDKFISIGEIYEELLNRQKNKKEK